MNHDPEQNESDNPEEVPESYQEESSQREFDDLVTIARFSFPYQAHLLAGKLESEGIMAFVFEDRTLQLMPWLDNTLGGIRVQVKTSDEIKAHEVLKAIDASVTPASELHEALDVDGRAYDLVKGICPECGTASVYLARAGATKSSAATAFVLLLNIPMKLDHNYFCFTCHYEWKG